MTMAMAIGFYRAFGVVVVGLFLATGCLVDPRFCSAEEEVYNPSTPPSCPTVVCLDVRQGSRYYGRFHPVSTPTSVQDFYDYHHYSFNGDDIVPLLRDQSLFLIHYDNDRSCDLSLVVVHDSKEDYTGGQAHLFVSGNHQDALVQDGPGDGSRSDRYVYRGSKDDDDDRTELFWEWGWQQSTSKKYRTDGIADRWKSALDDSDNDSDNCLYVSAKFIKGIDAWRFVPGSTSKIDPREYLYLDQDETLRVCQVDCSK